MSDRFFEAAADLFAVASPDGQLTRTNAAWASRLGDALDGPLLDLVAHVAATGDTVSARELQVGAAADGAPRWMLASASRDDSTGLVYLVVKDVDDRYVAEAELRARLGLEVLVTSLSTRFLNLPGEDVAGAINASLREFGELFGIDRVYVVRGDGGVPNVFEEWWADHSPRDQEAISDMPIEAQRWWARRLRAGEITHFPTLDDVPDDAVEVKEALTRNGVCSLLFLPLASRGSTDGFLGFEARTHHHRWSSESIALMRTVGEIFVSALDRARAEAALAKAARDLEQRNVDLERSNSELEVFASIASHDLKSPLRVVRGFLDLLERAGAARLGEEGAGYVKAAQRGAARMEELVDDLLSYARAGRGGRPPGPVDLAAVLADVLADSAAAIADSGGVVTVDSLPTVVGDETQLRQLLQNLVSNAMKFVDDGSSPVVHVTAERAGDEWRISVTDNGIGVAPDDRERIFAMFSRLHPHEQYPGTGIGLAVCERVVLSHGGHLWVEDPPDGAQGARFVFSLPAST